jgi:adenine-specific DNA-methyltransferase
MADHYDDYTREQLLRLLRERDRRPRFGLVWERDEIDHDLSVNNDFVALDWDAELSCGEGPQSNVIIEGDNFDALRYLRMTHAGRIKCIYIDPPYNTGNRDFIYNDRFVDKEDSYRHSKWLEFMYRRLELAKELLTEDGVMRIATNPGDIVLDFFAGSRNHGAGGAESERKTVAIAHPLHSRFQHRSHADRCQTRTSAAMSAPSGCGA